MSNQETISVKNGTPAHSPTQHNALEASVKAALQLSATTPDPHEGHESGKVSEATWLQDDTRRAPVTTLRPSQSSAILVEDVQEDAASESDASEHDHLQASSVEGSDSGSDHSANGDADASGQYTQANIEETSDGPQAAPLYWISFWLRKSTLLALTVLLIALAVSLIVLWSVNNSQNGFQLSLSTGHYAWTYGPTAVLIVILSFWRQVDYHCKLLQPWHQLGTSFAPAERNMLLDYLSPLQVTSFVRAVRYRHTPVAASIAGFAILKAIILLSTGLLVSTPVTVTESSPVKLTSTFSGAQFWDTGPDHFQSVGTGGYAVAAYSNISAQPVHAYLGGLREENVMPAGIANNMAFQTFDTVAVPGLRSLSADVAVFVPNISCEIARPTTRHLAKVSMAVQLNSATCSIEGEHQDRLDLQTSDSLCTDECMSFVSFNLWRVNCSQADDIFSDTPIDVNFPYDFRFALLVGNVTLDPRVYDKEFPNRIFRKPTMHQVAAVICKVDYTMHRSTVLHDVANDQYTIDHLELLEKFDNLTGTKLGELIFTSLGESTSLAVDGYELKRKPAALHPLYYVMLRTLDGHQSMDRFLSEETLQSAASQTWAGIGARFVQENFLIPMGANPTDVGGSITRMEDRLIVSGIAVWLMVVGFALVLMLTTCIMLTTRRDAVLRDPGLLSYDIMILASNPSLEELLMQSGRQRTSQLAATLHGFEFGTTIGDQHAMTITSDRVPEANKKLKEKTKAWLPLAARRPMMFLTLAAPLAVIVGLEILYRVSEANRGFLDVTGSETKASYISRYISALVVLLIATCFNGLDFTIALFAPYTCLQSKPIPAERGLDLQILGKLPPIALLQSIRIRHASSFFSKLAAITGSILTIIASGLWIIDRAVILEQTVEASQLTAWDIEWFNSSSTGDGGAGVLLDQIQHGSAVMPTTIRNGVVLPEIALIKSSAGDRPNFILGSTPTQNYTFEVNGLRPLLSCETIADEHITIQFTEEHLKELDDLERLVVDALPPLPPACQFGGKNGTDEYYNFSSSFHTGLSSHMDPIGNFYDLHLGPWIKNSEYDYGEQVLFLHRQVEVDNPAGCPSIGAIFVRSFSNDTEHNDVIALMCSQKVQQVRVQVTYSGTDTNSPTISANTASSVLESTARNLTNGTEGFDTFPYRVQTYLQANLTRFRQGIRYLEPIDEFMDHLLFGPNGTTPQELFSQPNGAGLIEAVQTLYGKYMSLVIDMRFRQPIPAIRRRGRGRTNSSMTDCCKALRTLLVLGSGSTWRPSSRYRSCLDSCLCWQLLHFC